MAKLLTQRVEDGETPRSKWHVQIRWNSTHRQARRAHAAVAKALRDGTLVRGKCEVCGSLRTEAHHDSYEPDQWLVVRWRCRADHLALHRELRRAAA